MNINEDFIYKAAFQTIIDSVEWGTDYKDGKYSDFVDGVCTLANNIIEQLKELEKQEKKKLDNDDLESHYIEAGFRKYTN